MEQEDTCSAILLKEPPTTSRTKVATTVQPKTNTPAIRPIICEDISIVMHRGQPKSCGVCGVWGSRQARPVENVEFQIAAFANTVRDYSSTSPGRAASSTPLDCKCNCCLPRPAAETNKQALQEERAMGREATAFALFAALASRHALGFHFTAPAFRRVQQQGQLRPSTPPSAEGPKLGAGRSPKPLVTAAAGADGSGGEGFSPPEEKMSRKAAKKAKARGGAPAIPVSKKESSTPPQQPQEVSKAVVAKVLGGAASDESAARWVCDR